MVPRTLSDRVSGLSAYATPVVALPAIGCGVAGMLGRGPKLLQRYPWAASALACVGVVMLAKSQFDRFWTEEPEYEVERTLNGLELRRYPPRVVAETVVETTSFDQAREEGFRRLAGYLFGANVARERFSMTVPVTVARRHVPPSEHLPMTAPVTLAASTNGYVMRFQMPGDRKLTSLPRPKDERVLLRRTPAERVAVLRFRGTYRGAHIEQKERELITRVRAEGLSPHGEPSFAGYDAPSALPFLRRIEVWVGVS